MFQVCLSPSSGHSLSLTSMRTLRPREKRSARGHPTGTSQYKTESCPQDPRVSGSSLRALLLLQGDRVSGTIPKVSHTLSFEISSVYTYCALSLLFLHSLQIVLKLTYLSIINGLWVCNLPSQTCLQITTLGGQRGEGIAQW